MMTDFTFAQLSDPHLTSLADVKVGDLLNKRLLGYLSWRTHRRTEHRREILERLIEDLRAKRPDHIVITGDLTHLGLPSEFRETEDWLHVLGPASDVTVVPGNHETYVATAWEHTFALWAPYMLSDIPDKSGTHLANGSCNAFPSLRLRGNIAFIGLSSAQPTYPFLATGHLDRAQLQSLEGLLFRLGREGVCRVVLIHHPPLPGMVQWRKSLTNAADLQAVLSRCGAELVLHGHAHRSSMTLYSTPTKAIPIVGVPSASAAGTSSDRRARYHLYHVKQNNGTWDVRLEVHAHDPKECKFFLEQERTLLPSTCCTQ